MMEIKPRWLIAKDSLGIVALGIVHDVIHCYNLEKKCFPPYIMKWLRLLTKRLSTTIGTIGLPGK